MSRKNKRLVLVIELILLIAFVGYVVHAVLDHKSAPTESGQQTAESVQDTNAILFASDYQKENGWDDPETSLSAIIDAASGDGKNISSVVLCGDYSNIGALYNYQVSPDDSVSEIRSLVNEKCPQVSDDRMLFVQGNHDRMTDSISRTGLHEFDDYLVYVINTQEDFPWSQGKTSGCLDKVTKASEDMKACLDELIDRGETRPVFIAGHVPLHFSARTSSRHSTGDNLYSSLIFSVVNKAAESLDIIYVHGHNHSKGWDCYMGGSAEFKQIGDHILIPEYDRQSVNTDKYSEEVLNFTYMNAGYVGYYMNCGPEQLAAGKESEYEAADMALTGTVCEITDDSIIITRYDATGVHDLGSEGCGDPYKDNIDEGLISSDHYSRKTASPHAIARKNRG